MTRLGVLDTPTTGAATVRADIIVQEEFRQHFIQFVATARGTPSWMSLPEQHPVFDVRWEDAIRVSEETSLVFLASEPDLYDDSDGEPV